MTLTGVRGRVPPRRPSRAQNESLMRSRHTALRLLSMLGTCSVRYRQSRNAVPFACVLLLACASFMRIPPVLADRLHHTYYNLYGIYVPSPGHVSGVAIGDPMHQLQCTYVMKLELIAALGCEQYQPQSIDGASAPGPALHLFRIVVRQHAFQRRTCQFERLGTASCLN